MSTDTALTTNLTTHIAGKPAVTTNYDVYWGGENGSPRPQPKLYGYRTATEGPGDNCFNEILIGARSYGWPVIMVLDNGGDNGKAFCQSCNNDNNEGLGGRYFLQWMNGEIRQRYHASLCYFRGNDSNPAKAYKDAKKFATDNGIDVSSGLTIVGFIYKGSKLSVKGDPMKRPNASVSDPEGSSYVTSYESRATSIIKWLDEQGGDVGGDGGGFRGGLRSGGGEGKKQIVLGKPYLFTEKYYNYCKTQNAPIAVIYYDTKTSAQSKDLYASIFSSSEKIKELYHKLSSHGAQDKSADKYKGGYCCLMVLDRRWNMSSADCQFFQREVLKFSNSRFIALVISYNGKTYCHQLPAVANVDQLADAIYQKCESGAGGVQKFSAWPERQVWIDSQHRKPDQETSPSKSGASNLDSGITTVGVPPYWEDPTAKSKYINYDPDYTGGFSGIPPINNRPEVTWLLNLADVSTPETTYYLIGSYDSKNASKSPWTADSVLTDYVNSDNKVWTKNVECHSGKYKELYENGKKYRFFVFYEFSHGSSQSITICDGFTYDYIWEHFTSLATTQRVWGIFDSCHSGSMIKRNGITPHGASTQFAAGAKAAQAGQNGDLESILGYLDRKFQRRNALLRAMGNGKTALAGSNTSPRLTLWASTGSGSYGWYTPTRTTDFADGMNNAFSAVYWDSGSTKYVYRQIRYGWAGARDGSRDTYQYRFAGKEGEGAFQKVQEKGRNMGREKSYPLDICVPQCRNYPQQASPETTILFY